jgi:iron only hydrogenase large subunit-like protein
MLNEKVLQEELAVLQADFDKTKKGIETMEKEIGGQKANLNAIYGALQQTEKLLKLSKGEENGKTV